MEQKNKPPRERQIEVMTDAKERHEAALSRWLAVPGFKAALRRRDEQPRKRRTAGH
jgi:hypothetical protein